MITLFYAFMKKYSAVILFEVSLKKIILASPKGLEPSTLGQ